MAEVKKINSLDEFNAFTEQVGTLNIVKLSAPWCGQCRVLEGTIKSLTDEEMSGVMLGEVDVEDEWFEDMAVSLNVRGIPVLIAWKEGEIVDRLVGLVGKDAIIDFFESHK